MDNVKRPRNETLERVSRIPDREGSNLRTLSETRNVGNKRQNTNLLKHVIDFLEPTHKERRMSPSQLQWPTANQLSIRPSPEYEAFYSLAEEYIKKKEDNEKEFLKPDLSESERFRLSQENNDLRGKIQEIAHGMKVLEAQLKRKDRRSLFEDSDDDDEDKTRINRILYKMYPDPKEKTSKLKGPHEIGGSRKSRSKSRSESRSKSRSESRSKSRRKSRRFV